MTCLGAFDEKEAEESQAVHNVLGILENVLEARPMLRPSALAVPSPHLAAPALAPTVPATQRTRLRSSTRRRRTTSSRRPAC